MIVIGTNHHNSLSIIRCLGQKGVQLDVILYGNNIDNNYVTCSKYVRNSHCFLTAEDAVNGLTKFYVKKGHKQSVITCSDEIASIMDYRYDELNNYFNFFNCGKNGRLTHYMDKQVQVEVAKDSGITVPFSQVYKIGSQIPNNLVYPCIVKPLESIHGGKKIAVCKDFSSLLIVLKTYHDGDVVQIQQYINGDFEIVVDGLSLETDIIIPGYIKKFRDLKGGTTYSESNSISSLPYNIIASIKTMVKKMQYVGLFGIELIVSQGTFYFVEINLRNDATTYTLAKAGVNLPYIYYLAFTGYDYTKELAEIRNIRSMVEYRDFDFVLKRNISLWQWIQEKKNCDCLYFADVDDHIPAKKARKNYIKAKVTSLFRKLHILK